MKSLQLDHNQMAFVIVKCVYQHADMKRNGWIFIQGFPNQINEAFTKMNLFVMQQYVYSSEQLIW